MEGTPICGIFGYVGKSKNKKATWEISNALMIKTEIRGEHATGFWSTEVDDGPIWYDKEAVKPTEYAKRSIWKNDFPKAETDLMIGHCRQCSVGVGNQNTNRNNHPHVTDDCRIALVHNGRVPEHTQLKSKFELHSECDSEILLALYETGYQFAGQDDILKEKAPELPPELAYRAVGMTEIFRHINYGWMAIAVGERCDDGSRLLWLHRDSERPIHLVDLRDSLGQIFFFSTPEIWRAALSILPVDVKNSFPAHQEVGIFPPDELWLVKYSPKTEVDWSVYKWKISRSKFIDYDDDDEDGKTVKIKRLPAREPGVHVVTRLNEKEEVIADFADMPATQVVYDTDLDEDKKKISGGKPQTDVSNVKHCENNSVKEEKGQVAMGADIEKLNRLLGEAKSASKALFAQVESKVKEKDYGADCVSFLTEQMVHILSEIKGTHLIIK